MAYENQDPPREWPATLPVDQMREAGWRPHALHQFLLKTQSRCNLACDVCTVHAVPDENTRRRPKVMPVDLVAVAARRIAEHTRKHEIGSVQLTLHGGDPLFAEDAYLSDAVEIMRAEVGFGTHVDVTAQVNGALLDDDALRTLQDLNVKAKVCLDTGWRAHADAGSFDAVATALTRLSNPHYRHLHGGMLCAVDLDNDPVETYEILLRFQPPMIDFVVPYGTWESPPPGRPADRTQTPYGDWLIAVFDRWHGARKETRIRLFEEIGHLFQGGASVSEAVGLAPSTLAIIETDGTIEQTDSLRLVRHDAIESLNIVDHAFDEAQWHPGMVSRQMGWEALSDTCKACRFHRVCGGGVYAHRYRSGTGFRNPSVYCDDLYRLIGHIRQRFVQDLRHLSR
ncbi:radical SAM protein [Nonomuraea sp. NPDC050790]|uniref:radical SAM protein n=1 Tax=Nonomuraea sp. NPDC050790 TaxID=3364371 RepID=UPI003792C873